MEEGIYESSKLVFSICHAPATKLFHISGSATRNWAKLLSSSAVLLAVQSGFSAIFPAGYFLGRQSSSSTDLSLLRTTKVLISTPVVLDTEGYLQGRTYRLLRLLFYFQTNVNSIVFQWPNHKHQYFVRVQKRQVKADSTQSNLNPKLKKNSPGMNMWQS